MNLIAPLLLQIILIFLNAVFAMAEIAVISTGEVKLEKLYENGNRRAGKLLKLKSDPARFLATIQVAITLSGFMGSAFAADNFSEYFVILFAKFFPKADLMVLDSIAVILITLILSYFSLVFGELVPKRLAMRKAEGIALGLSGTVSMVSRVFAPLVSFLTFSTNFVLRLIGIDPRAQEEEVSEEDIRMMAEASAEQGIIEKEEMELIENIFAFDDLTVGELAIHRTDVSLLWLEKDEAAWEETIRSSRFTHYPICSESIDNVVGVLDTKDYFRLLDKSRDQVIEKAVRAPFFVPEGAKADVTLRNMQKKRVSFAVVLDEYAGFSGVISIKDLIECIVGDMVDGDEVLEKEEEIVRLDESRWHISGNASLTLVEKTLGVDLPDDYETISGFVLSLYGAVPEDGSSFSLVYENMNVLVKDVQDHQATDIILTLPEEKTEE